MNGIFDNSDNEIANNVYRKVTIANENKQNKSKKKNTDMLYWIGTMNSIKSQAEEIVLCELIYI